ncbi:MAG: hypothetical protein EZS28_043268, partial [Streblomastix strix]
MFKKATSKLKKARAPGEIAENAETRSTDTNSKKVNIGDGSLQTKQKEKKRKFSLQQGIPIDDLNEKTIKKETQEDYLQRQYLDQKEYIDLDDENPKESEQMKNIIDLERQDNEYQSKDDDIIHPTDNNIIDLEAIDEVQVIDKDDEEDSDDINEDDQDADQEWEYQQLKNAGVKQAAVIVTQGSRYKRGLLPQTLKSVNDTQQTNIQSEISQSPSRKVSSSYLQDEQKEQIPLQSGNELIQQLEKALSIVKQEQRKIKDKIANKEDDKYIALQTIRQSK